MPSCLFLTETHSRLPPRSPRLRVAPHSSRFRHDCNFARSDLQYHIGGLRGRLRPASLRNPPKPRRVTDYAHPRPLRRPPGVGADEAPRRCARHAAEHPHEMARGRVADRFGHLLDGQSPGQQRLGAFQTLKNSGHKNSGQAPILMRLPWPDTKLPKNFARPAPSPFAILFIRSQFRNCERQGVGRKGGHLR